VNRAPHIRSAGESERRSDKIRLDRGLALTDEGDELAVLPTYTAMLALQAIAARRGLTRPYWEGAP